MGARDRRSGDSVVVAAVRVLRLVMVRVGHSSKVAK